MPPVPNIQDEETSNQIQVVDENQKFSTSLSQTLSSEWDLADQGFNYNVVAVFGSQSTGKSTLLNMLFDSHFDTMKDDSRQQTTKGIWMCKAKGAPILVMDVEGTDGRERGEDQDFERKSALFSLAIAEVVIVNMWEHMVGLYNGANMGLLKTVLEVNMQLFQQKDAPKTCLYFVIRDFTEQTPLKKLADTLVIDLEKIWSGITKPPGKENAKISDYFHFSYIGLPHKVYASANFTQQVGILKQQFYDKNNADYVFKPVFHKGIPADGFPRFAEAIWSKIVDNRDLDLPTQQQLLAQYRCDEIAKVIFEKFRLLVKPVKQSLENGKVPEKLGNDTSKIVDEAIKQFDIDAGRYNKQVFDSKRSEFIEKLHTELSVFYVLYLRNLFKSCIKLFDSTLQEKLALGEDDFAKKLQESRNSAETKFRSSAEAALLTGADWSYSDQLHEFLQEIERLSTERRKVALEKLAKSMEEILLKELAEPVSFQMNQCNPELWTEIISILVKVIEQSTQVLTRKLGGIGVDEQTIKDSIAKMKTQAWERMFKVCKDEVQARSCLEKLKRRFETGFRYDTNGIPRIWKPTDDIDDYYQKAKASALELLDLLGKIVISEDQLELFPGAKCELLSPVNKQMIQESFQREADVMFVDAKRSTVASIAQIPSWFVVLTIILGWNEFMAILRNPMFTLFVLILGGGLYVLYYTNMLGPAYQVLKVTTVEITKQARQELENRGINVAEIYNKSKETIDRFAHPNEHEEHYEMKSKRVSE